MGLRVKGLGINLDIPDLRRIPDLALDTPKKGVQENDVKSRRLPLKSAALMSLERGFQGFPPETLCPSEPNPCRLYTLNPIP